MGRSSGSTACPTAGWTCETEVGPYTALRLGYGQTAGDWLIYGHLGYVIAQVKAATVDASGTTYADKHPSGGWVTGLGLERQIATSSWIGRLEYSHYAVDGDTYTVDGGNEVAVKPELDVVRVGIVRRF